MVDADDTNEELRDEYDFSEGIRGKHFKKLQSERSVDTSVDASFKDSLESLMVWIRDRPNHYAVFVGELDTVLSYLHMVWAKFVNRESEYFSARKQAGLTALGLLTDSERTVRIDPEDEVTLKVVDFWQKVDRKLQIQVRSDSWHEN